MSMSDDGRRAFVRFMRRMAHAQIVVGSIGIWVLSVISFLAAATGNYYSAAGAWAFCLVAAKGILEGRRDLTVWK